MSIEHGVVILVSLFCFVFVLIKMFRDREKGGVLHGVIGILTCTLWAFIWGWIHNARHRHLRSVMIVWSIDQVVAVFTSPLGLFGRA